MVIEFGALKVYVFKGQQDIVFGNYTYETGSMTAILEPLKWEFQIRGGTIVDS